MTIKNKITITKTLTEQISSIFKEYDIAKAKNIEDIISLDSKIIEANSYELDISDLFFRIDEIAFSMEKFQNNDYLNFEENLAHFFSSLDDLSYFFSRIEDESILSDQKEFVALYSDIDHIIIKINQAFKDVGLILIAYPEYGVGNNNPLNLEDHDGLIGVFQDYFSQMKIQKMKDNFSFDILHRIENNKHPISKEDFERNLENMEIHSFSDKSNTPFYFGDIWSDSDSKAILLCHQKSTLVDIVEFIGTEDLSLLLSPKDLTTILTNLSLLP